MRVPDISTNVLSLRRTALERMYGVRVTVEIVGCLVLLGSMCIAGADPQIPGQESQLGGSESTSASRSTTFHQRYPRYELQAGDIFTLEFEFTPEFNQTVTVLPDGYVNLRGVGDFYIAGKTVSELTETIRGAYNKILIKPSIIVSLKDFEKPYFVASGQVGHPGKYELRADTTVVEGIAIAGGLTDSAKHSQVLLFRKVSRDWMEARVLDVKKMVNEKNLNEDLHLRPGDMIIVPQSKISKIRRYIPATGLGIGVNY
jgi:polysaccharide export outer membrane protein